MREVNQKNPELRADEFVFVQLNLLGFVNVCICNDEDGLTNKEKNILRRRKRKVKVYHGENPACQR